MLRFTYLIYLEEKVTTLNAYENLTITNDDSLIYILTTFEPVHEKNNNLRFRPGPTQTRLNKHRRWLKAGNFGFRKKRNRTIRVAKTKALISFAVTAKLICAFVFVYANCCFSHAKAHFTG